MEKIAAAFILFTRLPLWRWVSPGREAYSDAVVFWPLVGWLTGGVTALVLFGLSCILPVGIAAIVAIIVRLLLTGALHEDGLADFCDGFGCGGDKERILTIMKDSHIGTYGVLGLIAYFLLLVNLLEALPGLLAACAVFAADPFGKLCASQLTNMLRYARPEGAKNKISYRRMGICRLLLQIVCGTLPLFPLLTLSPYFAIAAIFPIVTVVSLAALMSKKIGGYTGDCCGATFLLCELSMITGVTFIAYLHP
ncbi:MAG: adenosylcobinamide-GDP ribazoletransferase [Bacteroides sp.]|nr:adenosylcobinamide-GDP ribazoletransferase [Bacteroides sp.]